VLCFAVAIGAVIFTRVELHGSGSDTHMYLYYNDRAWTRANHPVQVNEKGVYYAPLTFFIQLSDVSARINETLQTFVITRGDRYLSFDIATHYAANQDKIRIPLRTYEHEGERYVPMDAVCYYLDLDFEVITSVYTGDVAVRVTNGQQQYTFSALLRKRHPEFFEDPETTPQTVTTTLKEETTSKPPKVTEPPITQNTAVQSSYETTSPPPVSTTADTFESEERVLYLSMKGMLGSHTDDVLDLLYWYSYKATFFVDKEHLCDNIPLLMRVISSGHTLGIYVRSANGYDEILAEIEECNAILSRLTKHKTSIWIPGEDVAFSDEDAIRLNADGYTRWSDSVEVDENAADAKAVADGIIADIRSNDVCSIGIRDGDKTVEILEYVLGFTDKYGNVCDIRTADRPKGLPRS